MVAPRPTNDPFNTGKDKNYQLKITTLGIEVRQDLSFEDITYDPTNLLDYIWSEPSFGPFRLDVNDLTNLNLRY